MNCIAGAAVVLYDIRRPETFARARTLCADITKAVQCNVHNVQHDVDIDIYGTTRLLKLKNLTGMQLFKI